MIYSFFVHCTFIFLFLYYYLLLFSLERFFVPQRFILIKISSFKVWWCFSNISGAGARINPFFAGGIYHAALLFSDTLLSFRMDNTSTQSCMTGANLNKSKLFFFIFKGKLAYRKETYFGIVRNTHTHTHYIHTHTHSQHLILPLLLYSFFFGRKKFNYEISPHSHDFHKAVFNLIFSC